VGQFKYFGTTLKSQNSFREEIKSVVKSWKASYRSLQNLLSSKNIKIKMYITIILPYFILVWNLVAQIEGET